VRSKPQSGCVNAGKNMAIRMKKMMKWITANEDLIHYSKNDGN
jgi:hypothetical protein